MLLSLGELQRYRVHAIDGDVGEVVDFFFQRALWTVRWLVVRAGERAVVISPVCVWRTDCQDLVVEVDLSRERLAQAPGLDPERPLSRQEEIQQHQRFGWPFYWGAGGRWGPFPYATLLGALPLSDTPPDEPAESGHLRRAKELSGCRIIASDGEVGHLDDFIVEDDSWVLRYLVADLLEPPPAKKVLLPTEWIDSLRPAERALQLRLSRRAIEESPAWNPSEPVNRAFETRLYDYYGRPVYWPAPHPA